MTRLRVLVTDADTPKGLAVVRALGLAHKVCTASRSWVALPSWSRYANAHFTYADHFPESL